MVLSTPLPRGPPPPRPLHEQREMSLALSNAIGHSFLVQGCYLREALTLLPSNWEYLNAVVVQVRPMTPADALHPHVLSFEEAGPEEEATTTAETAVGAETGTPGMASSSIPEASATAPWTLTVASAKPKNRKLQVCDSVSLLLDVSVLSPRFTPAQHRFSGDPDLTVPGSCARKCSPALTTDLLWRIAEHRGQLQPHKSPTTSCNTVIEITFVQGVANCTGIFRLVARYIGECDTYEANTFMECGMYASTTALHAIYNSSDRILWRCRSPTWFLLHPTVRAKLPDFCQCTDALIHSRHPAWLAASVSDHDLHRRDEVASTAQWAGRLNGHARTKSRGEGNFPEYICEAAGLDDSSHTSGVPGDGFSDCTSTPYLRRRLLGGATQQPGRSQVRPRSRKPFQDQSHSSLLLSDSLVTPHVSGLRERRCEG